ncbi:hypothetical protein N7495_003707 [Penicillium taxi]|uniref:uncharacterized protein n=1 Tax=Penicillium taxi TaxID=168475 RepID=UPI00254541E6|nr:uncharacterized protein N7495_003707 [Penicillium taxi]KAJ5898963.1 hypothetical protein N7495_003707 [Penicillium taxi]
MNNLIVDAGLIFNQKFPELAFLHLPTFVNSVHQNAPHRDLLKVTAVLALCARFLPEIYTAYDIPHQAGETYASQVRKHVLRRVMESPSVDTIQILLLMALYEWGASKGHSAWMYSGMASRMAQSLRSSANDGLQMNQSGYDLQNCASAVEIENRTFWGCFVMDRMLACGKGRPLSLRLERMSIHAPVGDKEFAYTQIPTRKYTFSEIFKDEQLVRTQSTTNYRFSVTIRGLDIWAKLLKWVAEGGRRHSTLFQFSECPWEPGSAWFDINHELENWRREQDADLKFPEFNISAHVSLGCGESFAFINLIYYLR